MTADLLLCVAGGFGEQECTDPFEGSGHNSDSSGELQASVL